MQERQKKKDFVSNALDAKRKNAKELRMSA